jgi:hypothetical protein
LGLQFETVWAVMLWRELRVGVLLLAFTEKNYLLHDGTQLFKYKDHGSFILLIFIASYLPFPKGPIKKSPRSVFLGLLSFYSVFLFQRGFA